MRSHRRCRVTLLVCFTTLALGACNGGSGTAPDDGTADGTVTSGTIGGLAFTVVEGTVTQESEDEAQRMAFPARAVSD